MLSSSLKEGATKVIEFPDKDPKEWKRIYSFFEPGGVAGQVTEKDLATLLPWFSLLAMSDSLDRCDQVLKEALGKSKAELDKFARKRNRKEGNLICAKGKTIMENVLEKFQFSVLYTLKSSKTEGLFILKKVLASSLELLSEKSIQSLVSILKDDAARDHLWPIIKEHLPTNVPDMDPAEIVKCPMFPATLLVTANSRFLPRNNSFSFFSASSSSSPGSDLD